MVGIIPKTTKKAPEWHKLALYVVLGLLVVVILGYALLFYFEGRAFNSLQNVEEEIAQVSTKEERIIEVRVLATEKKINDFSKLLQDHKRSSKFFTFLEETSHPKVWFLKVELITEKAEALVSGQAESFETLGQQLFIFQEHELIKSVDLTDLLIGEEGETEFSFSLHLDPQIFQ